MSKAFFRSNSFSTTLQLCWILAVLSGCSLSISNEKTLPITHDSWSVLLAEHVDENGMIDYKGFEKDKKDLDQYLGILASNPPNHQNWSDDEQLAYWINLYNAFTVQLIIDHLPLESIKDIGPNLQIPFVNTPWQINFIEIDEKKYNLDDIEHRIIRSNFNEPRIHFALVCAARSCPRLRKEAYIGEDLDKQLTDQANDFLNDVNKNRITSDRIQISKIFKWFKDDFKKETTLIEFLNRFTTVSIDENADINYMEYDWRLNEQ